MIGAMIAGLLLGYLLFHKSSQSDLAEHQHQLVSDTVEDQIWTCSMHPQIRQAEPGLCPICEMELIPLTQEVSDDPTILQMTESSVALAQIATQTVGMGSGTADTLSLSGRLKADERRAATQTAHVPGRIEQLFVTFTGEPVKAGQKLATIYSPELVAAQKELLEAMRFADTNMDLPEAARNKLRNWKISEEVIQQVQMSGEILQTITIYADRSGVVLDKRVNVGDYVKQGEALFTLADLSRLWVLFDTYEEDLPAVKEGDKVMFTTPSLPNRTFTASISFIDPLIDAGTRVATARAEVPNPGGILKPEMFVRGKVMPARQAKDAVLTVPKSAVMWTGKRSVVYVEMPNVEVPSYQYREVNLGDRLGDQYEITAGLEADERVVVNGAFVIDAAAQLNNQASMMNKKVLVAGHESVPVVATVPDYRTETPTTFKEQIGDLALTYLRLKDAFVQTDASAVQTDAAQFLAALGEVDMSLLKGDAHMYWMEQLRALSAHAGNMAQLRDIEEQRRQFDFLSRAMIHTVKAFGAAGKALYIQHCPMAFDNTGADWISEEEAIRNPYFGDKMMKCGSVLEQLVD